MPIADVALEPFRGVYRLDVGLQMHFLGEGCSAIACIRFMFCVGRLVPGHVAWPVPGVLECALCAICLQEGAPPFLRLGRIHCGSLLEEIVGGDIFPVILAPA